MKTVDEAIEAAIWRVCDRAGLDVAEGVRSVRQTLEANGYVIVPREATFEIANAYWGQDDGYDVWRDMIDKSQAGNK